MNPASDPRAEAERLVATLLGRASVAAESLHGFATGSAECCVCPICRAIAAARDPNPDFAERMATGAADLASGLASALRAFSGMTRPPRAPDSAAAGDPWRTVTRANTGDDTEIATAQPVPPPKPMAKKAVRKPAPPQRADPESADGDDTARDGEEPEGG